MACYQRFARVYDYFMTEAPYGKWVTYIDRIIKTHLSLTEANALVLDMACGTGNITLPMAKLGYDVIGVDRSVDMLAEARFKAEAEGLSVLFLAQDMRALDLYGTVDAALCVCDGLNYIPDEAALSEVFTRVARFLNPGGVFIFDMNTEYKFKDVLSDKTFTESGDGASYFWKNHYDAQAKRNEYDIHFFTCDDQGRTSHFDEKHYQYVYPPQRVAALLQNAGLSLVQMNDAYTDSPPRLDSERISFVATARFATA